MTTLDSAWLVLLGFFSGKGGWSSDEYRGGSGEADQVCKWCSVVTTGTKPTPTKEQPITNRHTDHIRTRQNLLSVELSL